jgi:DHA2 family methylenomycin A resistance protein-like MFS transporter
VFRRPEFRVANAAALTMNLTANGLLFVMTRYLQSILGHDALVAGLIMVPMFVPLVVLAPVAGRLSALHILGPAAAAAWLAVIVTVMVTWSAPVCWR